MNCKRVAVKDEIRGWIFLYSRPKQRVVEKHRPPRSRSASPKRKDKPGGRIFLHYHDIHTGQRMALEHK